MSIPANSPLNLGLVEALDRLGIKGALLPPIGAGVQPVMVLGDISASISSELLEARRWSTMDIIASPGNFGNAWIHCSARGGLVVEKLIVSLDGAGVQPDVIFQVLPGFVAPFFNAAQSQAQIGGVPAISDMFFNVDNPGYIPATNDRGRITCLNLVPGTATYWTETDTRFFVPAGFRLALETPVVNARLRVSAIWRELADIQGAP